MADSACYLAARGLTLARAILPDLIVLNMKMAAIDGHSVIHRLKDDPGARYIPLMAMMPLAMEEAEAVAKGYDGGFCLLLQADLLCQQIQTLMRKYGGA